jgi:hypothetical protein
MPATVQVFGTAVSALAAVGKPIGVAAARTIDAMIGKRYILAANDVVITMLLQG